MSHGDMFNLSEEEKQERREDHYRQDHNDWERETTRCLLSEIKNRLKGCNDPYCLTCANTDALVDVLRDRIRAEIDKAIEHDQNRQGARREYGSILHNKPAKGR